MPAISIAVVPLAGNDPGETYRWSVSRDGEEVGCGIAADENEAYEAAKPLFEMLRLQLASVA